MIALAFGNRVYTKDGKFLGTVSDFRDDKFKVDAPMAIDYWLARDQIEKVEHGSVLMAFQHAELPEHRTEAGAV